MQIRMQNNEVLTREQINDFLKGTEGVSFVGEKKKEVYAWVERVLVSREFLQQDKKLRGTVRAYVEKVTGTSVAQTTRLIRAFLDHGVVRPAPVPAPPQHGRSRRPRQHRHGGLARPGPRSPL